MGFSPPVFFWVAHYNDKTVLPQYDFESGTQNRFSDIDQSRLVGFGWYPFTAEFAEKLSALGLTVVPKDLPTYELQLIGSQRLIGLMRQRIKVFTAFLCQECGNVFLAETEDRYHVDEIIQNNKPVKYISPICPQCKRFDLYVCPDDRMPISKNDAGEFYCHLCNKFYPKKTLRFQDEIRDTFYLLGWQSTISGRNIKSILFIDECGNVVVSDDFDKI